MLTLHSRLQLRALIQPNPVLHLMGSGIHSTPRTLPSPPAAAAAACCYALLHHCRPPLPRRRERACKNCMRLERESARIIILSVGFVQSFHTVNGKAYLFNKVVNISAGVHEEKMMMTGMYTVADIFCVGCGSIVGWRYETAHEKAQKYKEGKSVLQRIKISGPDGSNYGSDADDA